MTTLHAELCLQPGSRANFARLAQGWLTEGRARLFPELDRALGTAGPNAERPEDDDAPWGSPGGVWARLLVRQQPQAVGGLSTPWSQRAWRRTLDGLERSYPFQVRLEMTPLGPDGHPATAECVMGRAAGRGVRGQLRPGTAPFLVGQAAFTITVVVLFNLLAPAGWRVGLLRIQDVALGCAVSLVIGVLFWPRGAASVVGDDLADSSAGGSAYLARAVDWALGLRDTEPGTAIAAVTAGIRLDDALRGFLAEQGSKRMDKNDLWHLVMATMRLRLTAYSLAGLPERAAPANGAVDPDRQRLHDRATELIRFYDRVAGQVGHVGQLRQTPWWR
jgi:hypothetical protein